MRQRCRPTISMSLSVISTSGSSRTAGDSNRASERYLIKSGCICPRACFKICCGKARELDEKPLPIPRCEHPFADRLYLLLNFGVGGGLVEELFKRRYSVGTCSYLPSSRRMRKRKEISSQNRSAVLALAVLTVSPSSLRTCSRWRSLSASTFISSLIS